MLCVSLKLNGSSVGVWQKVLNEPGPIRGLVLFKPEEVRADEWSHITPSIIAQARHSPRFPIENESLGAGRSPHTVAPLFDEALAYFEKAEAIRPHGNDDALLRWNRCVRILQSRLGSDWHKLIETIDAGDSPPI